MISRLRKRLAGEDGVSLVELLVVMMFVGVIGAMLLTTFSTTTRAYSQLDDEVRGLSDLQTVVERLGRDLREARGVNPTATASQLTIWIDADSDYIQVPAETITWQVRDVVDSDQFDVVRTDGTGQEQVVGSSLVSAIAFAYPGAATPDLATTVRVSMAYDAVTGAYASSRTATFELRLRNAP